MDVYTESIEFRGERFTFCEMPLERYLDILDTVAEATTNKAIMAGQVKLLKETVRENVDFSEWPLAAVVGLGKLALSFHQRGGVDDDLKNSSNGRIALMRSGSAEN